MPNLTFAYSTYLIIINSGDICHELQKKKLIPLLDVRKYILEIDRAVFKVEPELITKQDEPTQEGPHLSIAPTPGVIKRTLRLDII